MVVIQAFMLLLIFLHNAESLNFSFSSFDQNDTNILAENAASVSNGVIQLTLTKNESQVSRRKSVGRISYAHPVPLWDAATMQVTDFSAHFTFIIDGNVTSGDGMAFFLAPYSSSMMTPPNSVGGCLGLINDDTHWCNNTHGDQFVAVEFDTYENEWDPSNNHLGIDVNSVVSSANVTWSSALNNGSNTGNAWVTYNSTTHNLSVFLTYADHPVYTGKSSLWYIIDLSTVLPELVRVGFSASTGVNFESHQILSWDFNSTLTESNSMQRNSTSTESSSTQSSTTSTVTFGKKGRSKAGLVGGIAAGTGVLIAGLACVWLKWEQRLNRRRRDAINANAEDDFERGIGPERFTYQELRKATKDFSKEGRLGEGGFGVVFKGVLQDPYREIAVKKMKTSREGKKEYVSEVRVISRLRHRNLVQLLGWCHDQKDLLLVYDYMHNGSLDSHLYSSQKTALQWEVRFKIARGLASALLYLHEEWEQCVLHRDIKSSNVMLDSDFNAKLGDFGLARLVDHELGSQNTALAGTFGYLAPECATTGKASKESDMYSFGVVALEIVCGRRPLVPAEEPEEVISIIDWVWNLYGKNCLLEAVDIRLEEEFDKLQIERLMMVGLWCCHPNETLRLTARQVVSLLHFEAPMPSLPLDPPVPTY